MKISTTEILATIVAVMAVCLSVCSGEEPIPAQSNPNTLSVQKAILPIDRSITLGGALQYYRYFRGGLEWKDMPQEGRNFVEVTGKFDADRLFATLLGPEYNIAREDQRFTKTHDLKQVERDWRPKMGHMNLTFRIMLNADGSIEPLNAWASEDGKGRVYYFGNDMGAVLRMIYRQTLPVFILDGFKRPTDM
jgi:hypothetical protein